MAGVLFYAVRIRPERNDGCSCDCSVQLLTALSQLSALTVDQVVVDNDLVGAPVDEVQQPPAPRLPPQLHA